MNIVVLKSNPGGTMLLANLVILAENIITSRMCICLGVTAQVIVSNVCEETVKPQEVLTGMMIDQHGLNSVTKD